MTETTNMVTTTNPQPTKTLWTRDFTIITIGSVISMLGNSLVGFAMSLMVLDYTKSTMLYAIYMVCFTFPQLVTPIVSGAILDRFSRKRMIYTLDFISAGIYMLMAAFLFTGTFNFVLFAIMCVILGGISSTYMVAYDSFYPLLITEGNYQKAYSISSMLETMTVVMVPVATFIYNLIGIAPLMVLNALTFFIAAVFETKIKHEEQYVADRKEEVTETNSSIQTMLRDIKEGMEYLKSEPGLLAIAIYFFVNMMVNGAAEVLYLPYFKGNFTNGEYIYILVIGMSFVGRMIGGGIHYKVKLPVQHKFSIALCIYIAIGILEGSLLLVPIKLAMAMSFVAGIAGVTSYTIRISSTQNYVPDEKKGRFNGAFLLLMTSGMLVGQFMSGLLSEYTNPRMLVFAVNMVAVIAAIILIGGHKKAVSKIYNTDN
ncbi:MAG: MFS transporter [Pseudobutyrivibrio sp.]|nr:MFS transporter [Pseudobutyrivibrio sp.]